MDAGKIPEVEMKELTPAKAQDAKDAEKYEIEKTKDVHRRLRLFRSISALLFVFCLLLLAVVLALALKLYEVQFIQNCPGRLEDERLNCSLQLCQAMYPSKQAAPNHVYQYSDCGKGWLKFEHSCYFLSKERLSWQRSRKECQKKGGDLVVIDNKHVQKLLTQNGHMLYWIGLSYSETQQWMWVNNAAPSQTYWANSQSEPNSHGSCALLRGQSSDMNSWLANSCVMVSHFICQKG